MMLTDAQVGLLSNSSAIYKFYVELYLEVVKQNELQEILLYISEEFCPVLCITIV